MCSHAAPLSMMRRGLVRTWCRSLLRYSQTSNQPIVAQKHVWLSSSAKPGSQQRLTSLSAASDLQSMDATDDRPTQVYGQVCYYSFFLWWYDWLAVLLHPL